MAERDCVSERTLAQRFSDEIDSFLRLRKERPVYAWLFLTLLAAWACYTCFTWYSHKEEVRSLHAEIEKLQSSLRQAEFENTSLKQTIAPLLAQAAKEFPGEEINSSLEKIVAQLEKTNPLEQPIVTASASVELLAENNSSTQSVNFMDRGGYAVFVADRKPMLMMRSSQSRKVCREDGTRWLGEFSMPAGDVAAGQPVKTLGAAQHIQVHFAKLEPQSRILGGNLVLVLNGSVRLQFEIPAQVTTDKDAIIHGSSFSAGIARLKSNEVE